MLIQSSNENQTDFFLTILRQYKMESVRVFFFFFEVNERIRMNIKTGNKEK